MVDRDTHWLSVWFARQSYLGLVLKTVIAVGIVSAGAILGGAYLGIGPVSMDDIQSIAGGITGGETNCNSLQRDIEISQVGESQEGRPLKVAGEITRLDGETVVISDGTGSARARFLTVYNNPDLSPGDCISINGRVSNVVPDGNPRLIFGFVNLEDYNRTNSSSSQSAIARSPIAFVAS